MLHQVTRESKLTLQMNIPNAVSSCGVEDFGVDELGQLYSAKRGNTSGAKKKVSLNFYLARRIWYISQDNPRAVKPQNANEKLFNVSAIRI